MTFGVWPLAFGRFDGVKDGCAALCLEGHVIFGDAFVADFECPSGTLADGDVVSAFFFLHGLRFF